MLPRYSAEWLRLGRPGDDTERVFSNATLVPSAARRSIARAAAVGACALVGLPMLLTACAPPDTVSVSTHAARTSPRDLSGAALNGNAYVFVPQTGGITSVSFFVDGGAKPFRTDNAAPFDLVGNSATG